MNVRQPTTKGPSTKDIVIAIAQITVGIGTVFGVLGAFASFGFGTVQGLSVVPNLALAGYMFLNFGGMAAGIALTTLLASVAHDKINRR